MGIEQAKKIQFEFRQDVPYEVVSELDDTVAIAICPKLTIEDGVSFIVWFDTLKDRIMELAMVTHDTTDSLSFETTDKKNYLLRPLTFAVFQERVLPKLNIPLGTHITNREEMVATLMDSLNYE